MTFDFDELDEIEEAAAVVEGSAEDVKVALDEATNGAAKSAATNGATAEKAANGTTTNGKDPPGTPNGGGANGVAAPEEKGAFDFDDLDDQEGEAGAAAAADQDRRLWAPIPEAVWNKLPGLTPKSRPNNMAEMKRVVNLVEPGEYWGLEFPFTPKMLREMGPAWLTRALHTAGTLPQDNAITKFVSFDVKAEDTTKQDAENAKWGGAGLKILLQVEFKRAGDLGTGMFVKMPHELKGGNERYKNSIGSFGMDWSEVTWYNLFGGRFGDLPLRTPKMLFCDMSRKTTNFINVVELIPYGKKDANQVGPGEYFPAPSKYQDWALPNLGVDYYYAQARTLAQFFAWHKQVREVTNQVEKAFMDETSQHIWTSIFGTVAGWGAYNSKERDAKWVESLKDEGVQKFMAGHGFPENIAHGFLDIGMNLIEKTARHCFPKELVAEPYLKKFFTEAKEMGKYCAEMAYYTRVVPEYFSLCHPNAQVDNAWYWKNEDGVVQCGLLDWGGVNHSAIPVCLGNGWIGAEPEMMDEHEDKLIQVFIDEYAKITGVKFDHKDMWMHIKLAHACVLYGCFANVGTLISKTVDRKAWPSIKNRKDPQINDNFLARCYFVQIEMLLAMWRKRSRNPYTAFQEWLKRTKLPRK